MANKKITSINDLIRELDRIRASTKGPTWFRGHADATWKLQPNFDRATAPPSETALLGRFRQNANLLLDQPPILPNDFGWMFLMQHYGVPTRLLDWSESPLVALYFALDAASKSATKNGALWVLFPLALNAYSTAEKDKVDIPSFEDEWLANYSVTEYGKGRDNGILPLAAIATRNNPRIQAQLGVFTISHRKKIPIEDIEDGRHCVRLIIPSTAKTRLNDELRTLGITKFQIFPELASIGESLKEDFL